jgi:hypothetical protein
LFLRSPLSICSVWFRVDFRETCRNQVFLDTSPSLYCLNRTDNTDSDTISYEMHSYYYRRHTETTHLYVTLLPNIVKPVFTVISKLNGWQEWQISVFSEIILVSSINKTECYNIINVVNCVLFMHACITLFTLSHF